MLEVGRLCMKIAGRDAGKYCLVVEQLDEGYVLVDGQTRRRKCNILHLEPLPEVLKLSSGASHEDVVKALAEQKIEVAAKSDSKKAVTARPKKEHVKREKSAKKAKAAPQKESKKKAPAKAKKVEEKPAEEEASNKEAAQE